jgi:hypothetical protein
MQKDYKNSIKESKAQRLERIAKEKRAKIIQSKKLYKRVKKLDKND